MALSFQNIKTSNKTVLFIILAVFFVVADRLLKALCLKGFFDQPLPLVGNIFSLDYVKNYYIAFSLPISGPILTTLIGIIIVVLLICWLRSFMQDTKNSIRDTTLAPLGLLIIGAALNFADRLEYGFVVDYFYLHYFTVFNLADCLICGGVIWLLYNSFKKNRSAVN